MSKISSRVSIADDSVERLQEILRENSYGAIGDDSSAIQTPADNMTDLIHQVDAIFMAYGVAVESAAARLAMQEVALVQLETQLDVTQDTLATIIGGIEYDEALDHATADLMDCFCAGGTADVSSDGRLVFDERVSLSKEDIKPMLREAIVRWIELKMSQ